LLFAALVAEGIEQILSGTLERLRGVNRSLQTSFAFAFAASAIPIHIGAEVGLFDIMFSLEVGIEEEF
jgi:hypothetical protein